MFTMAKTELNERVKSLAELGPAETVARRAVEKIQRQEKSAERRGRWATTERKPGVTLREKGFRKHRNQKRLSRRNKRMTPVEGDSNLESDSEYDSMYDSVKEYESNNDKN
jgi:hypothetical protein